MQIKVEQDKTIVKFKINELEILSGFKDIIFKNEDLKSELNKDTLEILNLINTAHEIQLRMLNGCNMEDFGVSKAESTIVIALQGNKEEIVRSHLRTLLEDYKEIIHKYLPQEMNSDVGSMFSNTI